MSEPITVLPRVAESEALKHSVDFTDELAGDTISTRTSQDVDTGLTVDQFSHSGAVVTFTVTPAAATAGKSLNFTVPAHHGRVADDPAAVPGPRGAAPMTFHHAGMSGTLVRAVDAETGAEIPDVVWGDDRHGIPVRRGARR